jgi:bacillithiol biosynthesis cysteine-adding enzyme BshC
MADAFGRWIEHVLGPHGLIVYDASDPDGKSMVKDVFTRELSTAGETARRAARIGAELESNGYHSQVPPQDDTVGLFVLDGGRQAIRQRDGRFTVGEHIYSSEALVQEAAEHPAGFSPNVLLRPIVQDTLFPTAAYVAGPNELAYLGQLRGVYEHFGIPMPIIYQRATATLVDSGALRFLTKYNQPVEALQRQDDAALNALLASQIPPVVESRFSAAASAIEDSLASLIEVMPALDPTLEGAAKSTLVKLQLDLESLHKKIIQAAKRRDETLRRQFQRTKALVFPNGEPQEREIGFVAFLNQYGPALVERLIAELPLEPGKHWVISI